MTETSDMTSEDRQGGTSRRTIFTGACAIGVAGVLAACGGEETPNSGGSTPNTGATTPGAAPTTGSPAGAALAKKSDIPVGSGKIFPEQTVVIVQPTAGQFVGFSAICSHQQCILATVSNGTINCGCHGSQFSATDGSVKKGPATAPLQKKQLKVEGDNISLA